MTHSFCSFVFAVHDLSIRNGVSSSFIASFAMHIVTTLAYLTFMREERVQVANYLLYLTRLTLLAFVFGIYLLSRCIFIVKRFKLMSLSTR